MKDTKIIFICCLVASIFFYISFVIDLIKKNDNWVVGLCMGTTFLCLLPTNWLKKRRKK